MDELLRTLSPGSAVLDLGCGGGSFPLGDESPAVFRVDLERPDSPPPNFTQADAARLPFPGGRFDVVISNHSLEHFENFAGALAEIGRVIKSTGSLYIAVPDSTTFSDRVYRWLGRGGGHVNGFTSAAELAGLIERATQLKSVAIRPLCASFSFLNRRTFRRRAPRRLLFLGGGAETVLFFASYILRLTDRLFKTRLSSYGWAFYFGAAPSEIDTACWTNVCIRCGSGHPSHCLKPSVQRTYACPSCGTINLFTDDKHYRHFAKI